MVTGSYVYTGSARHDELRPAPQLAFRPAPAAVPAVLAQAGFLVWRPGSALHRNARRRARCPDPAVDPRGNRRGPERTDTDHPLRANWYLASRADKRQVLTRRTELNLTYWCFGYLSHCRHSRFPDRNSHHSRHVPACRSLWHPAKESPGRSAGTGVHLRCAHRTVYPPRTGRRPTPRSPSCAGSGSPTISSSATIERRSPGHATPHAPQL
jgi:hypothetical protein